MVVRPLVPRLGVALALHLAAVWLWLPPLEHLPDRQV